jgi:hypothetical protein
MTVLTAVLAGLLAAAGEAPAIIVQAPDSPVKLDRATVLTTAGAPPIILYSATNLTADEVDTFTVIAYVFDVKGNLKARQTAPARRTLEPKSTKHSTIVLDGAPIDPTDIIVIAVNQAQNAGSNSWWRADPQPAAEAAVPRKP